MSEKMGNNKFKVKEWKKEIISVEPDGSYGKIKITKDYISVGICTGFDATEKGFKNFIEKENEKIDKAKIAFKKWKEEFKS